MSSQLVAAHEAAPVQFNFFDNKQFETMQRICKMFASSELVPDMYRASQDNPAEKAMANCMIAIEMAQRIGASPLMIMQNMVIIYGRPSWSSKFLVATVNTCGRFKPLQYRFTNLGNLGKIEYTDYEWQNVNGKNKKVAVKKTLDGTSIINWECVAYTTAKGSEDVLESSPITIMLAIQEGWYTKAGSKWTTMTKQMLMYRAASFWTSAYAPELSMGMKTTEEVMDIEDIAFEDVTDRVARDVKENGGKTVVSFDNVPVNDGLKASDPVSGKPTPTAQPSSQPNNGGPGF